MGLSYSAQKKKLAGFLSQGWPGSHGTAISPLAGEAVRLYPKWRDLWSWRSDSQGLWNTVLEQEGKQSLPQTQGKLKEGSGKTKTASACPRSEAPESFSGHLVMVGEHLSGVNETQCRAQRKRATSKSWEKKTSSVPTPWYLLLIPQQTGRKAK